MTSTYPRISGILKNLGANGGYYYLAPIGTKKGTEVVCGVINVRLTEDLVEGEYDNNSEYGIVATMGRSANTVAAKGCVQLGRKD
jgi:hypothetical protein